MLLLLDALNYKSMKRLMRDDGLKIQILCFGSVSLTMDSFLADFSSPGACFFQF